jgi:peptidoglycan hydrolase-like protein with peptidoglycan-binding domain
VNQLNWAAYQLQLNFNQATTTGGGTPYRVNYTIATLDEYNVFLSNAATAANYRYTPHVYWGNYNLWKIMTANGWGESSQTFSMTRIDEVNLPFKNQRPTVDPNERPIALAEVYHLITRNYTLGETSSDIGLLQRFLRQQGYFMRSEITSTFGVVTQNALFAFRRDKGIIISQPSQQCRNLINRDYPFGITSEEVKNLQQCLRELGLFDFPVNTGFYGEPDNYWLATPKTVIKPTTKTPLTLPIITLQVIVVPSYATVSGLWVSAVNELENYKIA